MNNIKGPIILDNGLGVPAAPGGYIGMGQATPETDPDSSGPRMYAGVGNPNGTLQAPIGSIWVESVTGDWYRNTNGVMAWTGVSGTVAAGSRVVYVDGGRTDTYTENGSFDTPYKTVQAAVNFAEANMAPSVSNPVVIQIFPSGQFYDETVVIKKTGVHLVGVGGGYYAGYMVGIRRLVVTNATAASLAAFIGNGGLTDPAANYGDLVQDSYEPSFNSFEGLGFGDDPAIRAVYVLGVGASNDTANVDLTFIRCLSVGKTYARLVNYVSYFHGLNFGTMEANNIAGLFMEHSNQGHDCTVFYDSGADQPADTSNIGCVVHFTEFQSSVILNGEARFGDGTLPDYCDATAIKGSLDINGTAAVLMTGGAIRGNVTVEGDASFELEGIHVQGDLTLDNTGGAVACTFDGGRYMGVLTDAGGRLTRNVGS